MTPRVRFAPSPTGTLHIGGARTALYNFLFARHTGGTLVLRIEDTDRTRSTKESEQTILEGLAWLGIRCDEGPHYQSGRLGLYADAAKRLLASGRAYEREDPGKGKAIVFSIDRGVIQWDDVIHGPIGRDLSGDPDLVLVKSDGFPTYNFACVVDDAEMRITHVIRGDDHVPNTPKQISLYRALGAEPPRFAHVPLILNPDGSKMSKDYKKKGKDGVDLTYPTGLLDYRRLGYLPGAVANFLALLGWSPGDDREVMSPAEMIAAFELERVQNRGAQFHVEKLDWLNGMWIRKRSVEELAELLRPFVEAELGKDGLDAARLLHAVRLQQERLRTLTEFVPLTAFAFRESVEIDPEAAKKVLGAPTAKRALTAVMESLGRGDWTQPAALEAALREISTREGLKFQEVAQPVRVAVTGKTASPPIHETLVLVGRERAMARLGEALKRWVS